MWSGGGEGGGGGGVLSDALQCSGVVWSVCSDVMRSGGGGGGGGGVLSVMQCSAVVWCVCAAMSCGVVVVEVVVVVC